MGILYDPRGKNLKKTMRQNKYIRYASMVPEPSYVNSSEDKQDQDSYHDRSQEDKRNSDSYRNYKEDKQDQDSYPDNNEIEDNEVDQHSYVYRSSGPAECVRGVMQVEVHLASGIKGAYFLGQCKTSPYVVVKYGHNKKALSSSIHKGGGSFPAWNETFFFNVMNPAHRPPLMHFEIWDHRATRKDHQLGRVSIENIREYVQRCPNMCTPHIWLPVFKVSRKRRTSAERGKLLVRLWFESKDETYFGDARCREDHTYSRKKEALSKYVNVDHLMTDTGIEVDYKILDNIVVEQYAGTVIRLVTSGQHAQ